eukprot:TRINITY_DN2034_c0_g1_i2.p3 TRINITY_DN2034_c0_g1~~TRINITY_DN2034_c0_g1_i2.p3  ORF type:complete len:367 (-),score=78.10 TRINITY_DN2034_c0_g1_i2:9591-10691(-)
MEAALSWLFPAGHRVPSGRAPSFTQPLLPAPVAARPSPPPGVLACPLPQPRVHARHATVGWRVDEWAHHSAYYVLNSRGQRIFVQTWRPPPQHARRRPWWRRLFARTTREKGIVYIIHGLNDHSNKYTRVAHAWVRAGYVVIAHDFHGHGRSDGYRAYTSSMQHYVDDARHTIQQAKQRLPRALSSLPSFILAHSLGGAVAIHLARDAPCGTFRGVMLTAPAVRVYPKPILKLLAPLLATLAPLLPVQRLKFDRSRRRANKREPHAYDAREDPLVVRSAVRARVGYEVLKSCDKIMSEAERFRVPVFVAHSRMDRVTNAKGTIDFHQRIGSSDKTVRLYDGSVHDLLAEKRHTVINDMVCWASSRL